MILKSPLCVDISHWDPISDFTGVYLGIAKATEADAYTDPTFESHFASMAAAGIHRGVYHFHRNRFDPIDQAVYFCDAIRGHVNDSDLLILDVEEGNESAAQLMAWFVEVGRQFPNNLLGIYSRKNILDPIPMTAEQKSFFRNIMTWTAGYPNNPDLFSSVPPLYIPDQTKWGPCWLWQYTEKGPVNGLLLDCNWVAPELIAILGEVSPIPTHDGVTLHKLRRFDTDCFVHVIDLNRVNMKITRPFAQVPQKVGTLGASLGFNGGGWGLWPVASEPNEYLIIEGQVIQSKSFDSRPCMEVTKDNKIVFHTQQPSFLTSWNVFGFDRMIAQGSVYNTKITNNTPDPRTVYGRDAQGRLVVLVCEGRSSGQKGLTFKECWSVMQEFGVTDCGNADGGYSSCAVNAAIGPGPLNKTYLVENRSIVHQVLFFAEGGTPPAGGTMDTYEVLVAVRPRSAPTMTTNDTDPNVPAGLRFDSDVTQVDAITSSHPNMVQVKTGTYTGKWLPLVYLGVEYVRKVSIAPPTGEYIEFHRADGSVSKFVPE